MSLIKLYSWLLEWLDTVKMVMVVHKQQNSIIIIIPNNLCYYNFALKSLPGGAPDQALLLAIWVAGHQPDGHGHLETSWNQLIDYPEQVLLVVPCPIINP